MNQLPPIYDNIVLDNSTLDGRLQTAPSHFKENFRMYFLTEKMRSKDDQDYSDLCDRVAQNKLTGGDMEWLHSRVQNTPSEDNNENFKLGKLSIIVTTNKKHQHITNEKLNTAPNRRV